MPTNEERREVAARLRELAEDYDEKVPAWSVIASGYLPTPIDDVFMACGLGRAVHATEICGRLADLIEPEERTCRMEPTGDGSVVCSACRTEYTSRWLHEGEYVERYCPNCGAKVIQE